ncbi:MAG: hypothetical protein M3Q22_06770 [Actinomycetota bacterium]|nr:hypothetical protein [Actinomycetota bacterium]
MAHSPAVAKARAALGIHHRWHADDTAGLTERRRDFVTEKLAAYIERTLAEAPPLTAEQRQRLTSLLRTDKAAVDSHMREARGS